MSRNVHHGNMEDSDGNVVRMYTGRYPRLTRSTERDSGVFSDGNETTRPACENDTQLPQVAKRLALAFGNVFRSLSHHVGALEGQLKNIGADKIHLESLRNDCAQGVRLAYKLMLFGSPTSTKLHLIDLNDVIRKIDPIISRTVRSGVNTETDLADEALPVMGDARLLKEVLTNLISNANDAVPRGGTITVATRKIERQYRFSGLESGRLIGTCALLSVVDSGPGIDPSIQHRIFEPFCTTKRSREGIGLGLSIVQAIVRAHHGCLNIASRRGEGTMVRIYLPLQSSDIGTDTKESA